jgi:hypothetical protein
VCHEQGRPRGRRQVVRHGKVVYARDSTGGQVCYFCCYAAKLGRHQNREYVNIFGKGKIVSRSASRKYTG